MRVLNDIADRSAACLVSPTRKRGMIHPSLARRANGCGIGRAGCWFIGFVCLVSGAVADEPKKRDGPTVQVPYRLTDTKHVLVRAKLNGKGPYNFILDTGAPALYVSTAVAKKLGVEPDAKGWGTFDRFEIEGGVVIEKAKGKIDDPFQLEGMNKLGLAGVELHGVIGYNVLARYRIGFDFTKDKMPWTRLDFDPPLPEGIGGKGGVDAMSGIVKIMATLLGNQMEREIRYRGFLGAELAEKDGDPIVEAVLDGSPAKTGGLKTGDRITHVDGQRTKSVSEVRRAIGGAVADDTLELTVLRDGAKRSLKVQLGKGF
ncbi:MAG: PDZ domain-containing protein [Gemmataceae bacterium]|nr:PDZ domain-containing protein [Gemmataceae bacterium]